MSGNPACILERLFDLLTPSCRKWGSIDLADRRGVKRVDHLTCVGLLHFPLRVEIALQGWFLMSSTTKFNIQKALQAARESAGDAPLDSCFRVRFFFLGVTLGP